MVSYKFVYIQFLINFLLPDVKPANSFCRCSEIKRFEVHRKCMYSDMNFKLVSIL